MQMPGHGGERVWVCSGVAAGGCSCPEVSGGGNGPLLTFLPGTGVGRGLGRWTKQPWFPRWPRFLSGLITGCRVTCESSHSIRNANAGSSFSPFPPMSQISLRSQTQNSPAHGPSWSLPTDPTTASLLLCKPCPSQVEAAGLCRQRGSPLGRVCGGSDPAGSSPGWWHHPARHISSPSHLPSLSLWLNPSPGSPSPRAWWWQSSGGFCVGWRPSKLWS